MMQRQCLNFIFAVRFFSKTITDKVIKSYICILKEKNRKNERC